MHSEWRKDQNNHRCLLFYYWGDGSSHSIQSAERFVNGSKFLTNLMYCRGGTLASMWDLALDAISSGHSIILRLRQVGQRLETINCVTARSSWIFCFFRHYGRETSSKTISSSLSLVSICLRLSSVRLAGKADDWLRLVCHRVRFNSVSGSAKC